MTALPEITQGRPNPVHRNRNVNSPVEVQPNNTGFVASNVKRNVTSNLKGPGDALVKAGSRIMDISDDYQAAADAEYNARLKMEGDQADDDMAEYLAQYKNDSAADIEASDLSTEEGIEEYTTRVARTNEKFSGKMDGSVNRHRYNSKLEIAALSSDTTANKSIGVIRDTKNSERATNDGMSYIAEFPLGSKVSQMMDGIFERVHTSGGALEANKKTTIFTTLVRQALTQRLKYLSRQYADPADLEAFLSDPLTRSYMSKGLLDAAQVGKEEQANIRFDNSPEGRKFKANNKFYEGAPKAKDYPSVELYVHDLSMYYRAHERAIPEHILTPGSTVNVAGTTVGEGKDRPPVTNVVPEGSTLAKTPIDGKSVGETTFQTPNPRVNVSFKNGDGSLTSAAVDDLRTGAQGLIPESSDINGSKQGFTDLETAYMSDVELKANEILLADTGRMTPKQALAEAERLIPNKPEKYDFYKAGHRAFNNAPNLESPPFKTTPDGIKEFAAGFDQDASELTLMLTGMKDANGDPLDLSKATDLFSAVQSGFNTVLGTFSDSLVHKETEEARMNLALLARDFIRLFSLNPRFVVKEQIILAKIFSDPSIWTNHAKAKVAIATFRTQLESRSNAELGKLTGFRPLDEKNLAVDTLAILGRIHRRMKRFEDGDVNSTLPVPGGSLNDNENAINDLNPDDLTEEQAILYGFQDRKSEGASVTPPSNPKDVAPARITPPRKAQTSTGDETLDVINAANNGNMTSLKDFNIPALIEALSDGTLSDDTRQEIRGALALFKDFTVAQINDADITKRK